MALIVETGANVANANSYLSLVDARALALAMGLPLAGTDPEAEAALAQAVTYLEGFRAQFQGHASNGAEQALAWPRRLVVIDNTTIDDDTIPLLLKKAQVSAANIVRLGTNLFPAEDGRFITEETVDVITTKYSDKRMGTVDGKPRFPEIDSYLRPLLIDEFFVPGLARF